MVHVKIASSFSVFLQSGAKINISDGSCPERIVTVTGSTDAIYKAFTLICNKFEEVSEWTKCDGSPMAVTPLLGLGGCGPTDSDPPDRPLTGYEFLLWAIPLPASYLVGPLSSPILLLLLSPPLSLCN